MLDSIKKLLVFDKKNIIRLIIEAAVSITGAVLVYDLYSEAFAGFIFFLLLSVFTFKFSSKKLFILDIIFPLYTSLFVLYYFQLGNAIGHSIANQMSQYWGFLLVDNRMLHEIPAVIFIYFLFRLFRMSPKVAAAATPAPFMLLSLINYFVYAARAHEFVFYDIFSVKTAMNVAGNYHFSFKIPIVFFALPYAAFVLSFIHWKTEKSALKARIEVPVAAVLAVTFGYLAYLGPHMWYEDPRHTYKEWGDMPTTEAGYYMAFVKSIGVSFVSKPEGYSADALNKELDGPISKLEAETENTPNIIVIMNESYADLDIYKDRTKCEKNPDPYWDSLKETCVHGWADSSVFAGNTANSEFEFLTGLSMGFLPTSSVPYHSYIEEKTYSINWALKDMGYETLLMHPYLRTGWNRLNVYPRLGFDKMMFVDDMFDVMNLKDSEDIDGKITDMAAYEKIIEYIENEKGDNKLFTFMVTMQNHSPYDTHETEPDVYSTSVAKPNFFNTYQTLVNMSDDALKMLTEYLSKQDEEYLVLIFGDHQPDVGITENEDFAFDGKGWKVPYLIWTNYDYDVKSLQPSENSVTSLNYLGLDVLKIAGFKYNNYYGMLDDIRKEVPCITVCGHKTSDGKLVERVDDNIYDNDADASKALLKKYHWFEYNQLFDENKSVMMKDYKFAQ